MQNDKPDEPPGSVSDQNAEEAEAGHEHGRGLQQRPPAADEHEQGDEAGAAGEGSQSTGQPDSAG